MDNQYLSKGQFYIGWLVIPKKAGYQFFCFEFFNFSFQNLGNVSAHFKYSSVTIVFALDL